MSQYQDGTRCHKCGKHMDASESKVIRFDMGETYYVCLRCDETRDKVRK